MTKNMLDIRNISIRFGGIVAVDNASLCIDENEIVALIGPNGAGKTTVFNILTGVYQTESGEILFKSKNIENKSPQEIVQSGVSRTFQNIRLFGDMRVIENVLVGMHTRCNYNFISGIFRTKKTREIEQKNTLEALMLLKELGLYRVKDEYAANLPYGDQRKLEIARAMATGAKLLLLDEPAAGMNDSETAELLEFISRIRNFGYTILLIEHDMNLVMKISDRVYVLDNGVMIAEGLPEEVANNEQVIEAYLGGVLNVEN